jgi:hypothetical protein
MKAFFVGGITDNSELDLDCTHAPVNYPPSTGTGVHRYRLHASVCGDDGAPLYAVYAPPEMAAADIDRIVAERRYPQRFEPGHRPG